MKETHRMGDRFGASVKRGAGLNGGIGIQGRWNIVCRDKHGNLKWEDVIENLVTNAGLNYILEAGLADTGSPEARITSWFIGLTDGTPTAAAGDTAASHAGWTEVTAYDETNRVAWTAGAVSSQSVSNSGSAAEFTISTNSTTVGGAFLISNNTKSGTTGILYAVGAFSGGDKSLGDGDTLTITATFTAAAAS